MHIMQDAVKHRGPLAKALVRRPLSGPWHGCADARSEPAHAPATSLSFNSMLKRRVPFALSYLVLGFAGWTMWLHYRSYALLRLYYLRFGVQTAAGARRLVAWGRGMVRVPRR